MNIFVVSPQFLLSINLTVEDNLIFNAGSSEGEVENYGEGNENTVFCNICEFKAKNTAFEAHVHSG